MKCSLSFKRGKFLLMSQIHTSIRYNHKDRLFYTTLRKRVDEYFRNNQISKYGNYTMVLKTICMFAFYLIPYFLLIFNVFSSQMIQLLLCVLAGFGMAGIGLGVMHDANHGSYSKNPKINKLMSYSLVLIGGSPLNWQLQHNNLHHTYTNIDGVDEDIAPPGILRFSPHARYKKIHRLQIFYAWFFYGLMTIMWSITKDFKQLRRYNRMGLLATAKTEYSSHLRWIIFYKVIYYAYALLIPLLLIHAFWWQILLGYFIMHFTAGLVLALIFQPAHVVEDTRFPLPDETGNMENDWAVHQLYTTANFAPKSLLFSWYVGGLNFQVEHHLFPNICHVHYKKLSSIVKETASEFGLPYNSQPTFAGAVWSHAKMLWRFGKAA